MSETAGGPPVAFYIGNEVAWDILEVRDRFRGKGYGTVLAHHYLSWLKARGVFGIKIQCEPKTSALFWQRFGFESIEGEEYKMTYRIVPEVELPGKAAPEAARFRVYGNKQLIHTHITRAECEGESFYVFERPFVYFAAKSRELSLKVDIAGALVWEGSPWKTMTERNGDFYRMSKLSVESCYAWWSGRRGGRGLKCPKCNTWYSNSRLVRDQGIVFSESDVCGNEAGSPGRPCNGILFSL